MNTTGGTKLCKTPSPKVTLSDRRVQSSPDMMSCILNRGFMQYFEFLLHSKIGLQLLRLNLKIISAIFIVCSLECLDLKLYFRYHGHNILINLFERRPRSLDYAVQEFHLLHFDLGQVWKFIKLNDNIIRIKRHYRSKLMTSCFIGNDKTKNIFRFLKYSNDALYKRVLIFWKL